MVEEEPAPARLAAVPPSGLARSPHGMVESSLRDVMSTFATGVTVLTAGGEQATGMTANAFTSVSVEPPLVLCCVARTARLHEAILHERGFGVSILAADQELLARYFADKKRPTGPVQFDAVGYAPGRHTGAPLLFGALAWVECELTEVFAGGDHSIFLGRVMSASSRPDRRALLFYQSRFHQVVPPARSA
jgi:flavin reductase (DIM6/NTAB) family NADH-FMN oxidoreductase RutF